MNTLTKLDKRLLLYAAAVLSVASPAQASFGASQLTTKNINKQPLNISVVVQSKADNKTFQVIVSSP